MDVKFVIANRDLVDTVPIADGQVIASKDNSDLFYDSNSMRRRVGPCRWEPIADSGVPQVAVYSDRYSIIEFRTNGADDIVFDKQPDNPNFLIGETGSSVPYSSMPAISKSNSIFLGWYADAGCTAQKVEVLPATYPPGRTIYYASWMQDPNVPL